MNISPSVPLISKNIGVAKATTKSILKELKKEGYEAVNTDKGIKVIEKDGSYNYYDTTGKLLKTKDEISKKFYKNYKSGKKLDIEEFFVNGKKTKTVKYVYTRGGKKTTTIDHINNNVIHDNLKKANVKIYTKGKPETAKTIRKNQTRKLGQKRKPITIAMNNNITTTTQELPTEINLIFTKTGIKGLPKNLDKNTLKEIKEDWNAYRDELTRKQYQNKKEQQQIQDAFVVYNNNTKGNKQYKLGPNGERIIYYDNKNVQLFGHNVMQLKNKKIINPNQFSDNNMNMKTYAKKIQEKTEPILQPNGILRKYYDIREDWSKRIKRNENKMRQYSEWWDNVYADMLDPRNEDWYKTGVQQGTVEPITDEQWKKHKENSWGFRAIKQLMHANPIEMIPLMAAGTEVAAEKTGLILTTPTKDIKDVKKEMRRSSIETAKELGHAYDPRTPEGVANLIAMGVFVKIGGVAIKNARIRNSITQIDKITWKNKNEWKITGYDENSMPLYFKETITKPKLTFNLWSKGKQVGQQHVIMDANGKIISNIMNIKGKYKKDYIVTAKPGKTHTVYKIFDVPKYKKLNTLEKIKAILNKKQKKVTIDHINAKTKELTDMSFKTLSEKELRQIARWKIKNKKEIEPEATLTITKEDKGIEITTKKNKQQKINRVRGKTKYTKTKTEPISYVKYANKEKTNRIRKYVNGKTKELQKETITTKEEFTTEPNILRTKREIYDPKTGERKKVIHDEQYQNTQPKPVNYIPKQEQKTTTIDITEPKKNILWFDKNRIKHNMDNVVKLDDKGNIVDSKLKLNVKHEQAQPTQVLTFDDNVVKVTTRQKVPGRKKLSYQQKAEVTSIGEWNKLTKQEKIQIAINDIMHDAKMKKISTQQTLNKIEREFKKGTRKMMQSKKAEILQKQRAILNKKQMLEQIQEKTIKEIESPIKKATTNDYAKRITKTQVPELISKLEKEMIKYNMTKKLSVIKNMKINDKQKINAMIKIMNKEKIKNINKIINKIIQEVEYKQIIKQQQAQKQLQKQQQKQIEKIEQAISIQKTPRISIPTIPPPPITIVTPPTILKWNNNQNKRKKGNKEKTKRKYYKTVTDPFYRFTGNNKYNKQLNALLKKKYGNFYT